MERATQSHNGLITQARLIHASVDFGKFDNEPSDSFALGFVVWLNPEDVYRAVERFSHVRCRFRAKAGPRWRKKGPDCPPVAPRFAGHSTIIKAGVAP